MRFLLSLSVPKPQRVNEIHSPSEIRSSPCRGHEGMAGHL